jgi:hypothetical protein
MNKDLRQRLDDISRRSDTLSPGVFGREGTVSEPNTTGERTRILRLRADTVLAIRSGRKHPFRVAVPAYENPGSVDGTADNTETFNLSHNIIESPNVQDAIVYIGTDRYGTPDAIDYANNSIDVTDPDGNNDAVYVWYVTDESATLEVEKAIPSGKTESKETLYEKNTSLVHELDQSEQPEYFSFGSKLGRFVATDMTLDVFLTASFGWRLTHPADDTTIAAENCQLNVPVLRGTDSVEGLRAHVNADMGESPA